MPRANYRAFLLRIWSAEDHGWRAVLEDPHTGEKRAFETPEGLLQAIRALEDGPAPAPEAGQRPSPPEES